MKRILFVLSVVLSATLLFTACEKNEYNINDLQVPFTVKNHQWTKEQDDVLGTYFYYEKEIPQLTREVVNHGMVMVYLKLVTKNGVTEYHAMPFDDFFVDENNYKWTEQVSFAFSPGYVTVFMKYDDQTFDTPYYESYDFQVRMVW